MNDWDSAILYLLKAQRHALSTRKIAVRTSMSWITAKKHLKKLEISGKIKHAQKKNKIIWELIKNGRIL
jgi:DNA-binding transcriptional regulator YhcF (GntR family)